ncbi:FUSC family protein [Amycolatopsis anabasis]|uniref:FUSC family protein n=1 Tax=Amycolatopsis anabasis TaxID=1840409 RepID=UPI00131BE881|nr:FUSC family protein [Amycolatopsis anabasis]
MKGAGMVVTILVVLGGVTGLGYAAGLGNASILAGLTALFCLIAAVGGPLRADLRLFAAFAPALVLGVGVPRLLGEVSPWAAIALLVVIVFVAGLVPALGARYVTVGLGLGMASLFGYGFQLTGTASAGQIIGAPALAVGVVLVLRLLMGARDPGKPTREALADALTGEGADIQERAARLWLADRPVRWTARVLGGTFRFRAAAGILAARERRLSGTAATEVSGSLEAAREEAARIAGAVRSPSTPDTVEPVRRRAPEAELPGATRHLIDGLWSALETVRDAALHRDKSRVDVPRALPREVLLTSLRGALTWRSAQLRHAVRCALGVLLALAVARLRPGDPLTVSFLMSTFAVMQPEWQDSLSRAWQRIAGTLAGAGALALVLWLLPQAALVPIGVVAVLIGFSFQQKQPIVFNACIVLMAVGVNATKQHLDPRSTLIEYVLLMLLAAGIGLVFGFAAVPEVRKPSLARRFAEATAALCELLTEVASVLRGDETDGPELAKRFRAAARTRQELVTAEPGSAEPSEDERHAVAQAVEGLRGLVATASALLLRREAAAPLAGALADVAAALAPGAEPELDRLENYRPLAEDDEQRLLLDTLAADLVQVGRAAEELR